MTSTTLRRDNIVRRIAAALVHYPILDRAGLTVTSAITNIDLHDIARSSFTFGLSNLFVIHPISAQRELSQRIQKHWVEGAGGTRIPDRKPAMEILRIVPALEDAIAELAADGTGGVEVWTTSAASPDKDILSFAAARQRLTQPGPPILLCFGTGWGLAKEVHATAAATLAPIDSPRVDGYNHLSVRAAAAITYDRLLGVG